jgi:peptide/nickel transport system permease protein
MNAKGSRGRYVLKRTAHAIFVIFLSYTLVFFTLFVMPGNPIYQKLHSPLNPLPKADVAPLMKYYHLNLSPVHQYVLSLGHALHGQFGYSLVSGEPVTSLFREAIPTTLALALSGLVIGILLAIVIAVTASFAPWEGLRSAARSLPPVFLSIPSFITGFVLLEIFSFRLGWVSTIQASGISQYILPAVTLGIAVCAPIAQVLSAGLTKASGEPFVVVLRAKGLKRRTIIGRHVMKNGSIPALTLLALTVGDLLAGAVIVETVFNLLGVGEITQQAVQNTDTPVIMAAVILVSAIYTTVNLITDLIYPVIDPRIALHDPTRSRSLGTHSPLRRKVASA